ncbi:cytochrome c [Comamonas sp. Y33R10-2]|nr:cytochrome c [Comamonas sp. Y33R10-2]
MPRLDVATGRDLPSDMLHGKVLHPSQMSWSGLRYEGRELCAVNGEEVRRMPGVVALVQQDHFVGVVAMTPVHASQASERLALQWSRPDSLAAKRAPSPPLETNAYTWRIASAKANANDKAIVWVLNDRASVWIAPVTPDFKQALQAELASLLAMPLQSLDIFEDASSAPVAREMDLLDAAADAALLSKHVQRPVSVQCTEHAGDDQVLTLKVADAGAAGAGIASPIVWASDAPWSQRPSRARLLTQKSLIEAVAGASVQEAGSVGRALINSSLSVASVHDLNAAQVFAHESELAQIAVQQGQHPIEARLEQMPKGRGRDLALAVLEQSGGLLKDPNDDAVQIPGYLSGRGFASSQVECLDAKGEPQTVWSAWVADVAVNVSTGDISVTRVVAGHDVQSLQVAQQASMQVISSQNAPQMLEGAQKLLLDGFAAEDWRADNSQSNALASIVGQKVGTDVLKASPGDVVAHGRLADEGVTTLPAAAAIANAVQQATGVRLRTVPLDPQALRLALSLEPKPSKALAAKRLGWLGAGAAAVVGMAAMAWPFKPALPLTDGADVSLYSAQALERGRLVAAAGDCIVCHTAPGGKENVGGLGLPTPFGTIFTTNITPDNETGIGRWSYAAFERAMRHGVHQDGRQLYPAFPYTAFAKMNEGDMQALYGYLMSQPAVKAEAPKTELVFPYSVRSSLAGWNLLFHDAKPFEADRSKSVEWNRGSYLVNGAGHCSACHTPRNALGAEKSGIQNYLAGGEAEGWTAPAINKLGSGPSPWSKDDLVRYMRTGYSANHGVAAGPMAPVIHGLAQLPQSDVQSIATYLLDLPGQPKQVDAALTVNAAPAAAAPVKDQSLRNGERMYQNACAVCHEAGAGPTLFGVKPDLSKNTSLYASTPQNLIQVVLHGIQEPANDALGHMPGFKDSFDNQQIDDLLGYLRGRFAPEEKAWPDSKPLIEQLRTPLH